MKRHGSMDAKYMSTIKKKTKTKKKLTKTQMRVAVAKDVIAQLKSRKLIAQAGTYCDLGTSIFPEDKDRQVNEVLKDKTCTVCALGGIFVAQVNRFNDLKVCEVPNLRARFDNGSCGETTLYDDQIRDYIRKVFTPTQMSLIETAFEGRVMLDNKMKWDESYYEASPKFQRAEGMYFDGGKNIADKERMILIMQNIIDNNGTFVPAETAI